MEDSLDTNYGQSMSERPVSFEEWMLTLLVVAIPIVGIVMLFVWALGSNTNTSKSNWAKAVLVWMIIGILLAVLFFSAFAGALVSLLGG